MLRIIRTGPNRRKATFELITINSPCNVFNFRYYQRSILQGASNPIYCSAHLGTRVESSLVSYSHRYYSIFNIIVIVSLSTRVDSGLVSYRYLYLYIVILSILYCEIIYFTWFKVAIQHRRSTQR